MVSFLLIGIYAVASIALLAYGINCYVLVALFLRRRRSQAAASAAAIAAAAPRFEPPADLPLVATQIPLFNEANVAERAIRAVAAIDYPRDRHEIQVLDDSDDETRGIVDRVAVELRTQGHRIVIVRRADRVGFKAGALALGLTKTAAEYVAIFDADFVPPRNFLRHTLPFFFSNDRLGLVQVRWGHLNDAASMLTRVQAIGIDGHFMVEQSARTFNGLFMNFNGTAGIWRRQAIMDAGGWSADTLTEDLDLSYRAQLAGWRTHYLAELEVPGELPASLGAFKSQQFRWAKGSIQSARKLLPRILCSGAPVWTKIQAALHLTHYAIHPLMLVVALLAWPVMMHFPLNLHPGWLPIVIAALAVVVLAPNVTYLASQRALHRDWPWRLRWLPVLTGLGVGLTINNTHGVLEALFGKTGEFVRTPKQGDQTKTHYRSQKSLVPWIELAMGLYCAASLVSYLSTGRFVIGSFLAVYAASFLIVAVFGFLEQRESRIVRAQPLDSSPINETGMANAAANHGGVRQRLFLAAVGGLLLGCVAMGSVAWIHAHPYARIAGFALLLPAGLAVTFLWPRDQPRHTAVVSLLLVALLARLALLAHPADSDANRYLWEGRLVREGESPYARVASDPAWEPLRDRYWEGMNQKGLRTIYPPVAEWTFAAVGGLWYHPIALKVVFIGFDLGVVALLIAMLAARGQAPWLAGLYAFNPIPLIGFAGEAHFDAMLLFFVLLALWLHERKSLRWCWIAFALAVQMKLVAIILLPILLRRGGWRTVWLGVLAVALPVLPYLAHAPAWLEGVRHFGANLAFNGSIHALAWSAFGDRPSAALFCTLLLAIWIVGVALAHHDSWRAAFWTLGGLVVLSPTVHYWYVAWALVFIPLFPSLAWLTLSGVMALYYLVVTNVLAGRDWGLPRWTQNVIWLTFGLALVREAAIALPALWRRIESGTAHRPVQNYTVVVPTLNEGAGLSACLHSLAQMVPPPNEVIVADGGSVDGTREIAAQSGATVVLSERGRGRQIAAGASTAGSDVVFVVHADSLVAPDTGRRLLAALNANPAAIGGAVGQRFDSDSTKLVVVEFLNDFRAMFLGVSFGDQGQFFRRTSLAGSGGFPKLPLMEDVEFSLRLRSAGPALYLGGGLVSSDRRWRRENWFKRCLMVVVMTARYRFKRRDAAAVTAALYAKYYAAKS